MDRNSLFVIRREDNIRIELMCGDSCNRNNIVYLPSRFINENPTIEEAYEGEIPFGLPLASSFKFTLDARMIGEEQAEIGAWIEANESPTQKKPNVWVVRKGENIIFAGIQQADPVEKYDLVKAEAEIQAVGVFKICMESIRVDNVMSASPTDTDLIMSNDGFHDFNDYNNSLMLSTFKIWSGRTKFKKFWDFINLCFGEIESKYQYYMRNYNLLCSYTWNNKPKFYTNAVTSDSTTLAEVAPYIISHIFHNNDNALTPATGAIPELQTKYKQLWNFFDELLKGWSYYAKINYSGSNMNFEINSVISAPGHSGIVDSGLPIDSIITEDTTSDKMELSKKKLNIRVSNARLNKFKDEDLKVVTNNINTTSLSGTTTEATSIFGNEPNTVANHHAGTPKKADSRYDIPKGDKPPVFGFYYMPDGENFPNTRVSDSCYTVYWHENNSYSFLSIDGLDNYNSEIRKRQSDCIAGATQKIRDKYLSSAKEQKAIILSVNRKKVGLMDLGNKYALDIANVYNKLPFYRHVTIPSSAMLGKIVDKLNENYLECTFYFQGE